MRSGVAQELPRSLGNIVRSPALQEKKKNKRAESDFLGMSLYELTISRYMRKKC